MTRQEEAKKAIEAVIQWSEGEIDKREQYIINTQLEKGNLKDEIRKGEKHIDKLHGKLEDKNEEIQELKRQLKKVFDQKENLKGERQNLELILERF